jgi:hypothetical protein
MLIPAVKPVIIMSLLTALLFCALLRPHTAAASAQLSESQAKAIFVFNIIRYVTWPREVYNSKNTIEIGILSKSANDFRWNILKDRTIQDRRLIVRKSSDIDDLRSCQIIYIDTTARKDLVRILNAIKQEPILTISDIDNFHLYEGGMITLNVINSKLNFTVNLATARKSSLDISSHLLKLAHEVLR